MSETPDSLRRLKGRRILITGAGSGIGLAAARIFAAEGAMLALLDLNPDAAEKLAAQTGGAAFTVDVSNEAAVNEAVARAGAALGGIDGVVNAAGIIRVGTIASSSSDDWRKQIDINLNGPFYVCRAAYPWLQKETKATVVNIASAQALRPAGASSGYAASKAGVVALSKAMAAEWAPDIRVNVICPGIVDTPMVAGVSAAAGNPSSTPSVKDYLLGRMADPEEIARALLFLTSDESSFVTGSALAVDGGRTLY